MHALEKYVGRAVRLKSDLFNDLIGRNRHDGDRGDRHENLFLVASVSRRMSKLICYGANRRVTVGTADVVLV